MRVGQLPGGKRLKSQIPQCLYKTGFGRLRTGNARNNYLSPAHSVEPGLCCGRVDCAARGCFALVSGDCASFSQAVVIEEEIRGCTFTTCITIPAFDMSSGSNTCKLGPCRSCDLTLTHHMGDVTHCGHLLIPRNLPAFYLLYMLSASLGFASISCLRLPSCVCRQPCNKGTYLACHDLTQ